MGGESSSVNPGPRNHEDKASGRISLEPLLFRADKYLTDPWRRGPNRWVVSPLRPPPWRPPCAGPTTQSSGGVHRLAP